MYTQGHGYQSKSKCEKLQHLKVNINNTTSQLKEYVHKGLVDLVLHEVGHTLGLRHNFKASTIFTPKQLKSKKM